MRSQSPLLLCSSLNLLSAAWSFYTIFPLSGDLLFSPLCCAQVVHSCPTLCDPMDCSFPGPSLHEDSSGKRTGMGFYAFPRGIFPTQEMNTGLPHYRPGRFFTDLATTESPSLPTLPLFRISHDVIPLGTLSLILQTM